MSSYIVEKITIDRILSGILAREEILKDEIGILSFPDSPKAIQELGQKMWDMNVDAVNYRYGETSIKPVYSYSKVPVFPVQALKSLRNFLYQCNENKIPERKLYKQLYHLSLVLGFIIATELPSYDKAEWG